MATIINNVAYSWAMITLNAPALTGTNNENSFVLQGVSAIKWNIKRNMQANYGIGGEPVNRGFGNREYTASITMDYNTQVELRALRGTLMALGEFDLVISFANQIDNVEGDWTTETVTLKGCVFNEDGMEAEQDATNLTKEFDLNPFTIEISASNAA